MANFFALDFEFDGMASQAYNLSIIDLDGGGIFSGVGSPDVTIHSQKVYRQDKEFFLGRSVDNKLEFQLTFGSKDEISGVDRSIISRWLFGRSGYKKLRIIQDDLNGAWFNCFLTRPEPVYIGNLNYAFKTTVVCDSPFAYSPLRTTSRVFAGNSVITYDFSIYNSSTNDDFLYPTVSFGLNNVGSSFSLTNLDDSNRNFLFSGLTAYESVIVDNSLKTIIASSNLNRLGNFNKQWARLVPGANHFHVDSGIGNFSITYYERMSIGG